MARFNAKLAAKIAGIQDDSEGYLRDLMAQGYTFCQWAKGPTACSHCVMLHGRRWRLVDFVANLRFSAPIFERSHCNCKCSIIVSGPGQVDEQVYAY